MKRFLKIFLVLVIVLCLCALAAIAAGAVVLERYSKSRVDEGLISDPESIGETVFYRLQRGGDSNGSMADSWVEDARLDSGVKYQYTSYQSMPDNLVNAFVAIEDKRFFNHKGIDYKRSIGAVVNYVFGGSRSFGGSTITQQLVKNLTGDDEPSVERKIKEAFCAIELERRLDKTEILEKYLNIINLAHGCFGVGAAARYYFSKDVAELSLSECASLAAITNNPTKYSPLNHKETHVKRRNTVLLCMLEQGYIDQSEYDAAINSEIDLKVSRENAVSINSWYNDMVVEDVIDGLSSKFGVNRQTASYLLYRGGYRIYTAMDKDIQGVLEQYYENECNFPISETGELAQSSMIVVDQRTGNILGVAGAIGRKTANRIQNYATKTRRPSGSVIKPLSVYAPAIDGGLINFSSMVLDAPIKEQTEHSPAWPANADGMYRGAVTVSYAMDQSLNTVAIRVLDMLGTDKSMDFLRNKLLINSLDEQRDKGQAALALGQMTSGVTLRELVSAYTIFDSGVMSKPRSYFKVTDSRGVVVLDNAEKREQVISEESAAIMTKLMQSVVDNGTAKGRISLRDKCEVAGKSGTTQNSCDRYFIGYTPTLLAGVWFGYDYPKPLYEFGGNLSITVWDEVMSRIYELDRYCDLATEFLVPGSVQPLSYDLVTGSTDARLIDPDRMGVGWYKVE